MKDPLIVRDNEVRATEAEAAFLISINIKNLLCSRKVLDCRYDHIEHVMLMPCPVNASYNDIIDHDLCPE